MRLLLKNENGCTVSVPIRQSDSFLDLKKRLFDEFGLESDFGTKSSPIDYASNVVNYLEFHSEESPESQICRFCGETFAANAMTDVSQIKDKINCLHLEVDPNNLLSNLVCVQCVGKLDDFKKFLDGCLDAKKKQLEILESHAKSCPFCIEPASKMTFVNNLDFLKSKERHKNVCSKTHENNYLFGKLVVDSPKVLHSAVEESIFRSEICRLSEDKLGSCGSRSNGGKKHKEGHMYCDLCPKSFRNKKRLEFHIEYHMRGPNARECTACGKEYSSEIHLYNHVQHNHTNRRLLPCQLCKKRFRKKSSLTYHLRSHESFEAMRPFPCRVCERRFARKNVLLDHMMTRHGVATNTRPGTCFQCQVCKESFPNTNSGISHTEIHHANEVNYKTGFSFNMQTVYVLFACEFCDKCYSLPHELMEHRLGHSPPLRYQCKICNEEFRGFAEMRAHVDDHVTDGIADYKTEFELPIYYVCEFCEKFFKTSQAFSSHCKTHESDKSYTCQFCSKSFSTSSDVLRHRRSHENVERGSGQPRNVLRPFECRLCQKAFTSNSSLTKHVRVHTGEKPFKCGFCRKRFSQSSGLYTHLKIHSSRKPYHCESCGKSFKLLGNYKQHTKRHL